MASAASASEPTGRANSGQHRVPKTNITRVRTGCLTCRRRRKKCDERKPTCLHCERGNHICDFPLREAWRARKRAPTSRSAHVLLNGSADPSSHPEQFNQNDLTVEAWSNRNVDLPVDANFIPNGQNRMVQTVPGLDLTFYPPGQLVATEPFSDQRLALGHRSVDHYIFNQNTSLNEDTNWYPQERNISLSMLQRSFIPLSLPPYPVRGIDKPIHRRLLSHFNNITHILTTFTADCDPFKAAVLPLALQDTVVMNAILSIAGTHLLKVQDSSDSDIELVVERRRLHEEAVRTQAARVNAMTGPNTLSNSALATSLLLCVYEICEGNGTGVWRIHLDMARQVIARSSVATSTDLASDDQILDTQLNPFLLEFYVYHNSLAAVTVPKAFKTNPHFQSLDCQPIQSASLVGVQDGLVDFIDRISVLRNEAESKSSRQDYSIIDKAVQIHAELCKWMPNPTWSKSRQLITTFYQWALFIWLFSIMRPEDKAHKDLQDAVHEISSGMGEIQPEDGVMACLLFPLFVVATAAITQQDRDNISTHFKRLRAWSSLGNVDLTYRIVEKMWEDHDNGVAGSWDWVKQLEDHNLSFMVT